MGTLIARREVCEDFTQFSVQTFMVFIPVSASVLVLNTPSPTTVVVVVVVGFLSTMSWTRWWQEPNKWADSPLATPISEAVPETVF